MNLTENQINQLENVLLEYLIKNSSRGVNGLAIDIVKENHFGKKAAWYSYETDYDEYRQGYVFWEGIVLKDLIEDLKIIG